MPRPVFLGRTRDEMPIGPALPLLRTQSMECPRPQMGEIPRATRDSLPRRLLRSIPVKSVRGSTASAHAPATARVSPAASGQLELGETSSRLVALLRERQKLLANVTRKKGKLEKLLATLDAQHAQMAKMASAASLCSRKGRRLTRVHGLFAAILARPSLNRKDRRLIQDLYEMLQLEASLPHAIARR